MATASSTLFQSLSLRRPYNPTSTSCKVRTPKPAAVPPATATVLPNRRQWLFLSTATTALTVRELTAKAQDIPLFGLRKKLEKVEEEAKEVLKEGIETAEKGIVVAEKELEMTEKGIESAGKEIESAVSFGGLAQAGLVAVAEVFGILIATSVVNSILGPEGQKS